MRLELGSGDRPTPGYVHLDCRLDAPDVDIVAEADDLGWEWPAGGGHKGRPSSLVPGSCEEIRATHLLEHFGHRRTIAVLTHWRSYLIPGGLLHLEVPNLEGHVNAWKWGQSTDAQFVEYLYGEQNHGDNYHKTAFTAESLRTALTDAGYVNIDVRDVGLVLTASARR
jgi:Methyltransferase domain